MSDDERYRAMIADACRAYACDIKGWFEEDGRPSANLGRVRVMEDDEDHGLFADTEGVLYASVVGAAKHNNEQVAFYYVEDGMDPDAIIRVNDPTMQLELI